MPGASRGTARRVAPPGSSKSRAWTTAASSRTRRRIVLRRSLSSQYDDGVADGDALPRIRIRMPLIAAKDDDVARRERPLLARGDEDDGPPLARKVFARTRYVRNPDEARAAG